MPNIDLKVISLPVERWADYKDLRLRALRKEPLAFGEPYAEAYSKPDSRWQERLKEVTEGHSWLVFAEVQGELKGMVGAFQDEGDTISSNAHIYGMYVDEDVRRRGIGRVLMTLLMKQLTDRRVRTAQLGVNPDQKAAKNLYSSLGFRVTLTEDGILGDGLSHPMLVMERRFV